MSSIYVVPGRPPKETVYDPLMGYRISDIDDSSNPKYYGFLHKDNAWYIMEENTTNKTYRYVGGSTGYEDAWENRDSQTYTYFNLAFS